MVTSRVLSSELCCSHFLSSHSILAGSTARAGAAAFGAGAAGRSACLAGALSPSGAWARATEPPIAQTARTWAVLTVIRHRMGQRPPCTLPEPLSALFLRTQGG